MIIIRLAIMASSKWRTYRSFLNLFRYSLHPISAMLAFYCSQCPTRQQSAFKTLEAGEVETLCAHKRFGAVNKGETLVQQGSYPKGVYCVQQGFFKLVRPSSSGKETIVRFAGPGDLIGYRAILSGEPVALQAVAIQNASTCFVPSSILFGFLNSNGPFSLELLKNTCLELSEANRVLSSLAQKSVKQRLAEVLLMLHAKFHEDHDGCIDVDLKRSELADLVGTATESLIRLLADFEKEKLICRDGKRFRLSQPERLAHLAALTD